MLSGLAPVPRQCRHSLAMVAVSWAALLCFVLPPYLDIFGGSHVTVLCRVECRVEVVAIVQIYWILSR